MAVPSKEPSARITMVYTAGYWNWNLGTSEHLRGDESRTLHSCGDPKDKTPCESRKESRTSQRTQRLQARVLTI